MDSRVEIARGWDLFRLGALAEAESLITPLENDPEALRLLLWIAIRRNNASKKQYYGERLARCDRPELAVVGRAHENVARVTQGVDPNPWLAGTSPWSLAEIAYTRALIAYIRDEREKVSAHLSSALPQIAEQRARYSQLRAFSKASADDFEGYGTLLLHALTRALEGNVDRTLTAIIAGSLALIIREVELREVATRADELLARVEWPIDPSSHRFYARWATAWRKATMGEWIAAMDLLSTAITIAPDPMRQALVYADCARISRILPENVSAAASRSLAFECIETIDWSSARGDDAICALSLMDVLSLDAERARRLFDSISSAPVSKLFGGGHGRRYDAFRAFALTHLNKGEDALQYAQTAYSLFKGMRHLHRAADCALRAVEAGGGARWRSRVEKLTASYPRCLAARRFEHVNAPISRIQGRRREVMEALVSSNNTAREIGAELGMKPSTVRDHIRHIYKTLAIENRSQLVRLYLEAYPAAYEDSGEFARERPATQTVGL
jgi:DNA-binding CsgD family transcriptional regulator